MRKLTCILLLLFSLTIQAAQEFCEVPADSVSERLENRDFPSVFAAWGGIGWSSVLNLQDKADLEQMAHHDLYFCCLIFSQVFKDIDGKVVVVGDLAHATRIRNSYLTNNPNMLFLAELRMRDGWDDVWDYSEFWIRDEHGKLIQAGSEGIYFIDFTHPKAQERIIAQAVAVAKCGLYDGIFLDWWNEESVVLADGIHATWGSSENDGFRGFQAEQDARDNILQGIRSQVREDFLILVNSNRRKFPRTAWAINGTFMETLRDNELGYTHEGLQEIESTLHWAEKELRQPRINCLEGWGVKTQPPDGRLNMKWMRVFTTLSLTHSDGYVLYNIGNNHQHLWYDFWNANLGKPLTEKSESYNGIDGVFMREYTNGWTVFNRSGDPQEIVFSQPTTGVHSSDRLMVHTLPDLDGEIYLKRFNDLNADGIVNVLDLVIIANSFGSTDNDRNNDGIVNVLDLVIVANDFGNP